MEGSADLARFGAKPVSREINGVPAVIHQDAAAGDSRITPPIRMIRVRNGAILDAQGFNLHPAQLPDSPRSQYLGRSPDDRRVFPIVDRDNGSSGFSREAPCLLKFNQVQQQRLFTKNVPSFPERGEHRLAVERGWRADIDKIDLSAAGQFLDCGKRRDAWQ